MFHNLVGNHRPDILDCISNLSSDEVFTPPEMANKLLDLLPVEVWSDPSLRWLDPATKSGVFLREAAKRLMIGLEGAIPDESARREHIFKNMLFGLSITELTGLIARRSLYYSKDASSQFSVVQFDMESGNLVYKRGTHHYVNGKCWHCGAPQGDLDRGEHLENYAYSFIHDNTKTLGLPYALKLFGDDMKFDVIIGNPPYQLQDAGESTGASPIYQLFVEQAKKLAPRYISMIIPSRWFAGGKGLDGFRETMLKDRRISHLVDYIDAADCFPGVEIKGGVCYFLWNAKHNGDCEITTVMNGEKLDTASRNLGTYDVFVRFNKAVSILEKVRAFGGDSVSKGMSNQKPFGFRTNFTDFKETPFPGGIQIYANKAVGWVEDQKIVVNRQWLDKYKVIISRSYNGGYTYPHQITNKPILAGRGSCCTETYIVAGVFDKKEEAESFESYMRTKFFRFMVGLRKITQDNPKDRFDFVPEQTYTKRWTDAELYQKYSLSPDEISFIESMTRELP